MFSKKYNNLKITYGVKYSNSTMEQAIENSFVDNTNFSSKSFSEYAYSEITGKIKTISYQTSIGVKYDYFNDNNSENTYSYPSLTPAILLGYDINKKNALKIYYMGRTTNPSLTELSNNKIFITEQIVSQGNPELKPFFANVASLVYTLIHPQFNFVSQISYVNAKNYINSYYIYENNYIRKTSQNIDLLDGYTFEYNMVVKPFKSKWLALKIYGGINQFNLYNKHSENISHLSIPLGGSIQANLKYFVLSYDINYPNSEIDGDYLSYNENSSHLSVMTKIKDFSLSASIFWLGTYAKYRTETVEESIIYYTSETKILDNRNMFTFNISYNFKFGKKYSEQKRLLENSDNDSGVFN